MGFRLKALSFLLSLSMLFLPIAVLAQSGFLGDGSSPLGVSETRNNNFDYSDYNYDTSTTSGFLGGSGADLVPTAVLESSNKTTSLKRRALVMTNFWLGLLGVASVAKIEFGVVTLNSGQIIGGTMLMADAMMVYAVVNTVLASGIGEEG